MQIFCLIIEISFALVTEMQISCRCDELSLFRSYTTQARRFIVSADGVL